MEPYSPGKPLDEVRREYGLDRVIKLASNENPFGPSPLAVEAVREAATRLHLYPDAAAHDLRHAIAQKYDVEPGQVLLGNGSDELIHLLGLLYLDGPHTEMVMGNPSFVRYDAAAQLAPAKLIKVSLDAQHRHDLERMLEAVTERTRLVFIANPNNPTGTIVSKDRLRDFLNQLPPHVTTVLDEAYFEFAEHAEAYGSGLELVKEGRNVVVLRTFSKAYGLAGIRIGFGFASASVVDAYHRIREPFNTNLLAQAAAIAALQDHAHLERTVKNNRAGLQYLERIFRECGATPVDSYANFAYADLGTDADPIFQALLRKGVIVRSGRHVGHPNFLRVSVGTPEELEIFAAEYKKL
jgi:histidinol-phosphate aminotransferase